MSELLFGAARTKDVNAEPTQFILRATVGLHSGHPMLTRFATDALDQLDFRVTTHAVVSWKTTIIF